MRVRRSVMNVARSVTNGHSNRSRRTQARGATLIALTAAAVLPMATARADTSEAVDVAAHDPAPPRRVLSIEWNPVALLIQRISANIEIAPADHHALVLSPFYFYPVTSSFTNDSGAVVDRQKFDGFGGEIGYRYYTGRGGLRGFYAGPSVFALFPRSTDGNGAHTSFSDVGAALDIGYQALVANVWVISVGGGAQYTWTSVSIPRQQMPATVVANRGVQPRVDFSVGVAF
jgi:hypothetical protein